MTHEKTFEAINKLKDIEIELHRLKNALEMANRALDAQRTWVGLTDDAEILAISNTMPYADRFEFARAIETVLKEKNNG